MIFSGTVVRDSVASYAMLAYKWYPMGFLSKVVLMDSQKGLLSFHNCVQGGLENIMLIKPPIMLCCYAQTL